MAGLLIGCGEAPTEPAAPRPPVLPQVSGTLTVEGLRAPVRVVRDRHGVPHIYAASQDDLFFAQGFVQAQDRLFQMDLWRRSVQGRLAEVLGANFIERDAMTRRIQYYGSREDDWTSYGPDVRAIAGAFVNGVNAWIRMAGDQLPVEFALAGWTPELWQPEDLLNRTEAFVAAANVFDEVFRARVITALGAARADGLLPRPDGRRTVVPAGLDPALVSPLVGDLLRRAGTPPFFLGFAASLSARSRPAGFDERSVRGSAAPGSDPPRGSNAWAVAAARAGGVAPLLAADPHQALANPSLRYLIHLSAPGWHVAGAAAPWRPGVAIGHNERIAWGWTAVPIDTQDLFLERVNPENPNQFRDGERWVDFTVRTEIVRVKGRGEPYEYPQQFTPRGVVIGTDREKNLAYTLGWVGAEAGGAAELAALGVNRASTWTAFRDALERWRFPAAEFVYADVEGRIGRIAAAAVPSRRGWDGALPAPGWTNGLGWRGLTRAAAPPLIDPANGFVASANASVPRLRRLEDRLASGGPFTRDAFREMQHDTLSWTAGRLVPLLERVRPQPEAVEEARRALLAWDRRLAADSPIAGLYVAWERRLLRDLAAARLPPGLAEEFVQRSGAVAVDALIEPSNDWFDGAPAPARDELVERALARVVEDNGDRPVAQLPPWGRLNEVLFAHPLALGEEARQRFNAGPFQMGGYPGTLLAVAAGARPDVGPSFRLVADLADWDRTLVTNAPGQSGILGSPHFRDLAPGWAAGDHFELPFSEAAVDAAAKTLLTLTPPP